MRGVGHPVPPSMTKRNPMLGRGMQLEMFAWREWESVRAERIVRQTDRL